MAENITHPVDFAGSRLQVSWNVGSGIYCIPTSDDAPNGWGEPFTDGGGLPINDPLGTVGGTNPQVLIRDKNTEGLTPEEERTDFRITRKYDKLAGNVSWVGQNPNNPGKDIILSWKGSPARGVDWEDFTEPYAIYRDHFDYQIFKNGKVVADYPFKVYGAALKFIEEEVEGVDVTVEYVYAASFDGTNDILVRKVLSPKNHPNYDSFIQGGWETVISDASHFDQLPEPGFGVSPTSNEPHIGWFFNASCTEAQCLRYFVTTLPGKEVPPTSNITTVNARYKMTINTEGASFVSIEEIEPWNTSRVQSSSTEQWLPHPYTPDTYFKAATTASGTLDSTLDELLAVDYVGDTAVTLRYQRKTVISKTESTTGGIEDTTGTFSATHTTTTDYHRLAYRGGIVKDVNLPPLTGTTVYSGTSETIGSIIFVTPDQGAARDTTTPMQDGRGEHELLPNSMGTGFLYVDIRNELVVLNMRTISEVGSASGTRTVDDDIMVYKGDSLIKKFPFSGSGPVSFSVTPPGGLTAMGGFLNPTWGGANITASVIPDPPDPIDETAQTKTIGAFRWSSPTELESVFTFDTEIRESFVEDLNGNFVFSLYWPTQNGTITYDDEIDMDAITEITGSNKQYLDLRII